MSVRNSATTSRRSLRRAPERGAVAVEFALVLPLLLAVLMGTFTVGLAYNDSLALNNAIREGARFGATTVNDAQWAAGVVSRTQAVYFNPNDPLQTSQVCASLVLQQGGVSPGGSQLMQQETTGCSLPAPAMPVGVQPGECIVRVWGSKPTEISILVVPTWNIDITSKSVSYYERTPCVPPATP